MRCAVATFDVRAGSHFGSNLRCELVRSATAILHIFGNNKRTDDRNLLSFGVSYDFVAQKWRILEIFHKKINFWEITCKILGFKTMFKN